MSATDRTKAGPDAATAVIGAPEGARVPQGTSHKDFALFGAPSPRGTPRETLFDMDRTAERVAASNLHARGELLWSAATARG